MPRTQGYIVNKLSIDFKSEEEDEFEGAKWEPWQIFNLPKESEKQFKRLMSQKFTG